MSKLSSLRTVEIVEDGRFSCRGFVLDARHRKRNVLTWILQRGYWTCFGVNENTHHLFKSSTVDTHLLHHLIPTSISANGPQTLDEPGNPT